MLNIDIVSLKLSQTALISGVTRHTLNARVKRILKNEEILRASDNQILLDPDQVYKVISDHIKAMDGKVICVVNPRSRVGKTSLSYLLLEALSELNFKVCCVDLDPQSELTNLLLKKNDKEFLTLYDFITKSTEISEIIVSAKKNIDIIPSSIALSLIEDLLTFDYYSLIRSYINKLCISQLKEEYDIIVIDTPSNLSVLSSIFLTNLKSGDQVLTPVDLNNHSIKTVQILWTNLERIKKEFQYIKAPSLSIVVNKFSYDQADMLQRLITNNKFFSNNFSKIVIACNENIKQLIEHRKELQEIKADRDIFYTIRSLLLQIKAIK
ncbi:ParA family protein [Francisella sp. SYW-2]|uniref:ParA family protein n=1 Tax=Francisella sp. SYW-2 TaxID=2610886 RepID=UPI00123D4386|nr:AAA family ATPase [Francisella sp. SYW-2]